MGDGSFKDWAKEKAKAAGGAVLDAGKALSDVPVVGAVFKPGVWAAEKAVNAYDRAVRVGEGLIEAIKLDAAAVKSIEPVAGDLFKVGRPVCFPEKIDPGHQISNYMRAKMAVTDLLPCRFMMPLDQVINNVQNSPSTVTFKDLLPILYYDSPIREFQKQCDHHGLPDKYVGLRLYSTDDSSADDTFANSYTSNAWEDLINKFRNNDASRAIRSVTQALGDNAATHLTQSAKELLHDTADDVGSDLKKIIPEKLEGLGNVLGSMVDAAVDILPDIAMMGNKISFPKIWDSSDFNPRFSLTVKLISPYGDPAAIKEFIIKPFMMLLILMAPKTNDAVSYGRPVCLTVNSYGLSYIPLAFIESISFRRGGSETAYTIYKQPLTIDVHMTFNGLCSGFGVVNPDNNKSSALGNEDFNIFKDSDGFRNSMIHRDKVLFHTLGHTVKSLQPMRLEHPIKSRITGKEADTGRETGSSIYIPTMGPGPVLPGPPRPVELGQPPLSTQLNDAAKATESINTNIAALLQAAGSLQQ